MPDQCPESEPHDWECRAEAGSSSTSRYQCRKCHCWGWRTWGSDGWGKTKPIRAYKPARFEAERQWLAVAGSPSGAYQDLVTDLRHAARSMSAWEFERRLRGG